MSRGSSKLCCCDYAYATTGCVVHVVKLTVALGCVKLPNFAPIAQLLAHFHTQQITLGISASFRNFLKTHMTGVNM
jgi:hypothetical protein